MSGREARIDVDLSIPRDKAQVIEGTRNVPYRSFTVISASDGATFQLGAGQGADLFPYETGDRWMVDDSCDPPVADGLYLTNEAQPGATVILQLGFSATRSEGN